MPRSRRQFLKITGQSAVVLGLSGDRCWGQRADHDVPVRMITHGPTHHWFGYYDKLEFDPSGRYVLGMEVDFEHRAPTVDDKIKIGMVDLEANDQWIELGESSAWGWQQGCMLQWIPGSKNEIIWNDRGSDGYISRILNVHTGRQRSLPSPIYALSPNGRTAVTADFRRINDVRPGYGYVGLPDPHASQLAPSDSGIDRVDLESGSVRTIISLADIAGLGTIPDPDPKAKHYFNHLLVNPDGSRFVFLHRWRYPDGGRKTRMLTANLDGSDIRVVDDNGLTSHFIWRDPNHLLAWSRQPSHGAAFYLFEDREDGNIEVVGEEVMTRDGHCTYLPDRDWIVNDTYPDQDRYQTVYLFHVSTGRRVEVGRFPAPQVYSGRWRCDTHPRHSPDGTKLVIDAPHPQQGRQLHLLDISEIVKA